MFLPKNMDLPKSPGIRHEIREISDADNPPEHCPYCKNSNFTRYSYNIREIQDLGDPRVKRIVRYESVVWICKKCETLFAIKNPEILERYKYMPSVIEYVLYRVLEKGDANRRVCRDLVELHNVEVSISTVNRWINEAKGDDKLPTKFSEEDQLKDFSGTFSIDGTFRTVKPKKNEMRADGNELPLLRLTHLQDGRLLVYWRLEKMK